MEAGRIVNGVEERGGFGGDLVEFNYSLEVRVRGGGGVEGRMGGAELGELVFPASSTSWFKAGESGEEWWGVRQGETAEEVEVMAMESEWIWKKVGECGCGVH